MLCRLEINMKICFACAVFFLAVSAAIPAAAGEIAVSGKVRDTKPYGNAALDITIDDFNNSGFALGDIVTVNAGSYHGDMPYLNGFYVDHGEYLLCGYPGKTYIELCVNYGNFAETAGIDEGDSVTIMLKEQAGALELQEINNLVYSYDRSDSSSDEEFANFRPIAEGKMYRCASPVDNKFNRARYADKLIRDAGVNAVMDLADSADDIEAFMAEDDFDSPYYRQLYEDGRVIALNMGLDYKSDEFASDIVRGFTFLAKQDTPYCMHCLEGRDRTGFAAMLLEALIGWNEEQIVADFMLTYTNFNGVEPGTRQYDMIAKNVREMLWYVAGLDTGASLDGTDLQAAAESYLSSHGMEKECMEELKKKLQ